MLGGGGKKWHLLCVFHFPMWVIQRQPSPSPTPPWLLDCTYYCNTCNSGQSVASLRKAPESPSADTSMLASCQLSLPHSPAQQLACKAGQRGWLQHTHTHLSLPATSSKLLPQNSHSNHMSLRALGRPSECSLALHKIVMVGGGEQRESKEGDFSRTQHEAKSG